MAALFARPCFATFLDQQPKDRERGHRVDPPGAERELGQEADHDNRREPAAVTASIASARNARLPSCAATASLRLASRYTIGIASAVTIRPGQENAAPSRCQRPQPAVT